MKIYFAGSEPYLAELAIHGVQNILVSYYSLDSRNMMDGLKISPSWFLDSGAYSAYTQGVEIDIFALIEFIKRYEFSIYAGLDVIGNAESTQRNCSIMRNAGLNPIPTFHFQEDFVFLRRYLEEYDYIAIGGVAQLAKQANELIRFLDQCWVIIRDYWPKRIHGFAIGSRDLLLRYPFYSVDCSTWLATKKYGRIGIYSAGRISYVIMGDLRKSKNPIISRDWVRLATNTQYRTIALIDDFLRLEQFCCNVWRKRGIDWNEEKAGD